SCLSVTCDTILLSSFSILIRPPPWSPLFPYTTLFRSNAEAQTAEASGQPEPQEIYVDVCGAVARPGVYALETGSRVFQAVEKARSEEHTSELQSRFDLVCRLLLEKKKTQ